jgi:heme/copper-type cytochrome/quinol oxidase subunit 2
MQTYTVSQSIADILLIYGIVIVVSLLVAVVIRVIVWTLSRQATQAEGEAPAKPTATVPSPLMVAPGMPQEHLAAIAAAIAMMGAHRIVRIEPTGHGYSWTATARSAHHLSHAPRKS